MLIVYRAATGEVVDNHGTNSHYPEGIPDDAAFVNTDVMGIDRATLGLLRLHDEEDADLVQQVLSNRHHVDVSGAEPQVIIDGPYPVRTLTSERTELVADGTDTITVVYTDTHDDAPDPATFDVNGTTVEVGLTSAGKAHLDVEADEPGLIAVSVGDLSLELTATAPGA